MQILQSKTAKSQLPMSNAARKQFGLGPEQLRVKNKNEQLPSHDLHLGQCVLYQDFVNKNGIQPLLAYAKNPEVTQKQQKIISPTGRCRLT